MGWVVAGYELLGPTISGCVEAVFVGAGKQKTNAIVGKAAHHGGTAGIRPLARKGVGVQG